MSIHTSYMDHRRRKVHDPQTLSASPILRAHGLNTTGTRVVNFWPMTDRLESRLRGFLQQVKGDRLAEERVRQRLVYMARQLATLIDEARTVWPGARLLAADDELVLVFGQQVQQPTEIARATVWGLDGGRLRQRSPGEPPPVRPLPPPAAPLPQALANRTVSHESPLSPAALADTAPRPNAEKKRRGPKHPVSGRPLRIIHHDTDWPVWPGQRMEEVPHAV